MDIIVIVRGNRTRQSVIGYIRDDWEEAERLCMALDAEIAGQSGEWHWWDRVGEIKTESTGGSIGGGGAAARDGLRLYAPSR